MTSSRPFLSIIAAVHNVEAFLPAFIASIDRQPFEPGHVEVIAVSDGSTDGSVAMLEAWASRRPDLVRIVTKENGGQASARNVGLEHATGEWVTFSDPDDRLGRRFIAAAGAFAARHPESDVLAARPLVLRDKRGDIGRHPRTRHFDEGDRVVDLAQEPWVFPGGTNMTVFRLDRVQELGLRFDERLRPVFEDVHFTARYLLRTPTPRVGLVADMAYGYRRRATDDSTLQRAWADQQRYTTVLRRGHLDLVRQARALHGAVPPWLQQVLLYDLSWYLQENERTSSRQRIEPSTLPEFLELFAEAAAAIDPAVVAGQTSRPLETRWRHLLANLGRHATWQAPAAEVTRIDRQAGLQRVSYAYAGEPPRIRYRVEGRDAEPTAARTASVRWFDTTFFHERLAWVAASRDLEVLIDDRPVPVTRRRMWPGASLGQVRPSLREALAGRPHRAPRPGVPAPGRLERVARMILARSPLAARHRGAWVLMDRVDEAGDNAERLFEYLRRERPDINAWFTVAPGTRAFSRLAASPVADRVVALGSGEWISLMLNCTWLISSHADREITDPATIEAYVAGRPWKLAFLQHGVTKDDISNWLNKRDFDLFVTTTEAETRAILEDGSPYIYTAREVHRTGMPRYDRLLELGRSVAPDDRDLVLVVPTWRKWLAAAGDERGLRKVAGEAIWDSEYLARWTEVLRSPELAAVAAAHGRHLAFMPHPNLQSLLPRLDLPAHVESIAFADTDAQAVFARTAVLVTDYSSVAFDLAALRRPVVHFQFDREAFFSGEHIGTAGSFDYERDGFGPVATTTRDTIAAIREAIEQGPEPVTRYLERMDASFSGLDGRACARVVEAIEAMSPRHPAATPSRGRGGAG